MVAAGSSDSQVVASSDVSDEGNRVVLHQRDRVRLKRMVALRMDARLRGRVDPSDVIQDAWIEASQRLADDTVDRTVSFFVWMRFLTMQQLMTLHRRHLATQRRDAGREVPLHRSGIDSAGLAMQLLGTLTRPSEAAIREELRSRVWESLDAMSSTDREVLVLRHFEGLTGQEVAEALGISHEAVKKRHVRALRRLRETLHDLCGGSRGEAE